MHKKRQPTKNKKKQNKNAKTTTINRMKTPWATRNVTRVDYVDSIDLVTTNGVMSVYSFNSNGLYDPDSTGTGHQPLGFDQLAAEYNRYRVLKVDYLVNFGNPQTSYSSFKCIVAHVNGSTVPSNPDMFETPYSKTGVVSSYGNALKLRGSFDLTMLNAAPANYHIDDRYSALTTGNPLEAMFIHLAVLPNASASMRVHIRLVYHAEFYDPVQPGASVTGHPVEYYKKQYQKSIKERPPMEKQN